MEASFDAICDIHDLELNIHDIVYLEHDQYNELNEFQFIDV
jgi:hypothetical protein